MMGLWFELRLYLLQQNDYAMKMFLKNLSLESLMVAKGVSQYNWIG